MKFLNGTTGRPVGMSGGASANSLRESLKEIFSDLNVSRAHQPRTPAKVKSRRAPSQSKKPSAYLRGFLLTDTIPIARGFQDV